MADYEIILVYDDSMYTTSKLCNDFDDKYQNNKCVHIPNGGLISDIIFCDADDYADNDLVYRVGEIANKYNPDIILHGL